MHECLPTTVANNLLTRMRRTHEQARIAIFTGPPGIGKTTAINAFKAEFEGEVAVVTIPGKNVRGPLALRHVIRSIRMMNGVDMGGAHIQSESSRLARELQQQLLDRRFTPYGGRRLTIVFDEAQTLSREAVETLRFYNDAATPDAPFPIGLIFVGNHELSLKVDDAGQSTISAAVASRASYQIELGRSDLKDSDYRLMLAAAGIENPEAQALVVRYFMQPRVPRDLRQLRRMIEELHDEAAGRPVTAETVAAVLMLA